MSRSNSDTWRDRPASEAQRTLIVELYTELDLEHGVTAATSITGSKASALIRRLIARRKIRTGRFSTTH